MQLTSSAFSTGDAIPSQYTCDGENISPPLSWDTPPDGTISLALIVEDLDAPKGTFTHWIVYNLPPTIVFLAEKMASSPRIEEGGLQGKNDFEQLDYGGPCPPNGTHRYFFKLYALDRLLELEAGANKALVEAAMSGHVLETVELMGLYTMQR